MKKEVKRQSKPSSRVEQRETKRRDELFEISSDPILTTDGVLGGHESVRNDLSSLDGRVESVGVVRDERKGSDFGEESLENTSRKGRKQWSESEEEGTENGSAKVRKGPREGEREEGRERTSSSPGRHRVEKAHMTSGRER